MAKKIKHNKKVYTLELFEKSMDVVYRFYPSEDNVDYYPDGSGYPGYPATVEIDNMWMELKAKNGRTVTVDIFPFVLEIEQDTMHLEEMIIEYETKS
jgi:hypothetical protein